MLGCMKSTRAEGHWRALIAEQEQSGQSVRQFAEDKGLSAWSMYRWRRRLGLSKRRGRRDVGAGNEAETELVAVDVISSGRLVSSGDEGFLVVEVGADMRVQVRRGFDEAELSRLLTVMRSSC